MLNINILIIKKIDLAFQFCNSIILCKWLIKQAKQYSKYLLYWFLSFPLSLLSDFHYFIEKCIYTFYLNITYWFPPYLMCHYPMLLTWIVYSLFGLNIPSEECLVNSKYIFSNYFCFILLWLLAAYDISVKISWFLL